jgi:glutamyl-tRNA reductase
VTAEHPTIIAIVAHARSVPLADRAVFGARLREAASAGLLLETCHRVELYAPESVVPRFLLENLPSGVELLERSDVAQHAIAVAVGLDSVVVGEDQVLHQLRTAVAAAQAAGVLDPRIERLMSIALRAGRLARSRRSGPSRTLADAALDAMERRGMDLPGAQILVVGTGQMGRLTVDRARVRGAEVMISGRTLSRASAIARAAKVAQASMDPGPAAGRFAGVVVALRGPWTLEAATIDELLRGTAIVADLSMPSALPERLERGLGNRFVSIDDLANGPVPAVPPREYSAMAALADTSLVEYLDWLEGHEHRSTAQALVRLAEAERASELDRLWRTHPEIEPEVRSAIERMSRHLTDRLLREPLERLGQDADGQATRAARELFAL